MTRKRFIKLVMSCEIQRNEAVKMADMVKNYGSYETMFQAYYQHLQVKRTLNRAKRAFQWLSSGIRQAAAVICAELYPAIQNMIKAVAGGKNGDNQNQ